MQGGWTKRGHPLKPPLAYPDKSLLAHAVFPVMPIHHEDKRKKRVFADPFEQGTAFFLSTDGLFLTARHVVEKHEPTRHSVIAISRQMRARRFCRVTSLTLHPELDVAIGIAEEPGEDGWPYPFTLATSRVGLGSAVLTYGYAKTGVEERESEEDDPGLGLNFSPRQHKFRVDDYLPKGPLANGPCYLLSRDPGGGVSGGPMIRQRTMLVHAVMSNGSTPLEGEPYMIAVDVRAFVDDWRIPFLGDDTLREHAQKNPRRLTIR